AADEEGSREDAEGVLAAGAAPRDPAGAGRGRGRRGGGAAPPDRGGRDVGGSEGTGRTRAQAPGTDAPAGAGLSRDPELPRVADRVAVVEGERRRDRPRPGAGGPGPGPLRPGGGQGADRRVPRRPEAEPGA